MGTVPLEVCDQAAEDFSAIPSTDATMGKDGETQDHSTRNTTVRFAGPGHWFEEYMLSTAMTGNQACQWDYDVTESENIQFAEYGPEQHYHWHMDVFPLSGLPMDRKLTVVCLLNDPAEFTGGEFQIRLYSEYTAPLVKGSVIAFPSFLEHRVVPVTSGVRKSATMWLRGPRFR
jgi:PKHD-type hydroxylase